MAELPPSRSNLDDVIRKLDQVNESTLRVQAAVEAPTPMKERFLDALPSTLSETKNTNRTLDQAEKIEKAASLGAQRKAIDDRVQTDMDIRETNENRDKIHADSKKIMLDIHGKEQDIAMSVLHETIGVKKEQEEQTKRDRVKDSVDEKRRIATADRSAKLQTDIIALLDKNAREAAEKRETELEANLDAGKVSAEQLEILTKIRDDDKNYNAFERNQASLIIKKFEDNEAKLNIVQKTAKQFANRIDVFAKDQFYQNQLATAEAKGNTEEVKRLKDIMDRGETPEDKEARQAQQKTFTKISSTIENFGGNFNTFLSNMGEKAKGGAFMALKAFGAGALLIGLIKFLESDYFDKFLDAVKGFMGFIDAIGEFLGPGGQLVAILGTLFVILNPIKSAVYLFQGAKLLAGLFAKDGGIMKGINTLMNSLGGKAGKIFGFAKNIAGKFAGLFSKGGGVSKGISNLTSSMSGKFGFAKTAAGKFAGLFGKGGGITKGLTGMTGTIGKTFGAGGKLGSGLASGLGKFTGMFAKGGGLLSGLGGIAGTVAKFAGPVGLAVTAGKALFDGASAGIEEYKKSGDMGAALREGLAGAASGLTFGLVSQETISGGLQAIGNAAGSVADGIAGLFKSDAEKQQDKLKAKQEQLDKDMADYQEMGVLEKKLMDEKAAMRSQGQFKTHAAYLASLQMQTDDQLAEIEQQRIESGDASKGLLGSLGQGMKNYYSFLGGLVPDGVKDIGKGILDFGKNLFGVGDDEVEKETASSRERKELEQEVEIIEGLSESSDKLADRADIQRKNIKKKVGGHKTIAQFNAVKNMVSTLKQMEKSDNMSDRITAQSVLEQIDAFDAKPGDGKVQMPTGPYSLKKFRKELFDIIDVMAGEDLIAVTDAKEVLRDFDLGQKIAEVETGLAEDKDRVGDLKAILQDGVVSEVEEKQLREAGIKDRFFKSAEGEANDEILKLLVQMQQNEAKLAEMKAEREGRNEMSNMLMAPTSNVVNNQTRNITPAPIMNPNSPYGVQSRNMDEFR